jgi:hypothetical protein
MLVTFRNAGTMPSEYIRYLLEKRAQWPGPPKRKGLVAVKNKLQALNWRIHRINVDSTSTELTIAATGHEISQPQ